MFECEGRLDGSKRTTPTKSLTCVTARVRVSSEVLVPSYLAVDSVAYPLGLCLSLTS